MTSLSSLDLKIWGTHRKVPNPLFFPIYGDSPIFSYVCTKYMIQGVSLSYTYLNRIRTGPVWGNHLSDWAGNLHAPISARSSTFHKILKLYQAFFDTVCKKSLLELQKDIGTCKFSAFNWSRGYWETVIKKLLWLNWICYERTGLTVYGLWGFFPGPVLKLYVPSVSEL